jgi:hypothetical protein
MRCRLSPAILLLILSLLHAGRAATADPLAPESATHFEDSIRPVLMEFCADCHDPAEKKASVPFLQAHTLDDVADQRGLWSSVAEQLQNRTMPPADQEQPSEDDRLRISTWIEQALRATACREGEYAGLVTPRRLNRFEYDLTIRDLVGVDIDASNKFPVDGSGGEGFDNNGETLFLPPILMERYLEAADEILDSAVITPPLELAIAAHDMAPEPEAAADSAAPRTIEPKQQLTALVTIYRDGDYNVRAFLGGPEQQETTVALQVDGIAAERFKLSTSDEPAKHEAEVRLSRGVHAISLRAAGDEPVTLHRIKFNEDRKAPSAEAVAIHERIFGASPGRVPDNPPASAEQVLAKFARRAFRRPLRDGEVERLLSLYERGAERGDPFEESVKLALKGVLVSPHFLFRIEADPRGPGLEPIGDHELATRLSYFLWSTMPDERLMRLADEGKLQDEATLLAEVDRMLDDSRSQAFAEQFIGQWLGTKEVGALVAPDTSTFAKQFTTELLLDLREEPVHFFSRLVAENRSLMELIDSDYAVVNERLARHYGLVDDGKPVKNPDNPWTPDPKRGSGGPFQVMSLPDDVRGGVLGMGSVHMVTSYPNRTSPVLRGGWVLETLLGVRVPTPPPDIPEFKPSKKGKKSLREQFAAHRDAPACAACHNLIDPLGFALENFDVLGRWRDKDGEAKIDASAILPSGESFEGPEGLRKVLLERREEFLQHLTRKMLGYALGRSLADGDECTVSRISETVSDDEYRTRTLVKKIVLSTPFRYRQGSTERAAHP